MAKKTIWKKNTKKVSKKDAILKNGVVVLLFVLLVGIYLWTDSSGNSLLNFKGEEKVNEYQVLMEKDVLNNYPASPREVVKLYQRISKALYSEELKDEEIDNLVKQLRHLLSDQLLLVNPLEDHLVNTKIEISSYKDNKKQVVNYSVNNDSLKEWEQDGVKYSSMNVSIGVKDKNVNDIVTQRYVLSEDINSNWKIYGFERVENK